MMDTLQLFSIIIGLIFSLAALFAGAGYFKQGKNQSKLDTVSLLKEQIDALEGKVKIQEEKIGEQDKKIAEMKNTIESLYKENIEKNKKLTETLQILQGRDPQMQAFVDIMKKYVEANVPLLDDVKVNVIPTIKKLDKFLDKQTF